MKYIKSKLVILLFSLLLGLVPNVGGAQTNPNAIVQDVIRFYFADIPIMIDIARCETNFRQYSADGSAVYDPTHTYVGAFQIAESIHTPRATSMGLDIRNLDGNLQYARYLYNSSGTNPWKGCLPKTETPVVSPTLVPVLQGSFTVNLRMGQTHSQIKLLQQTLNQNGYIISTSGVGSVGQETNYFGSLTREALKKFQCAKQIACDGNESTTGFGRVGPMTRGILNTLVVSQ